MEDENAWKREAACKKFPMPAYNDYWFPTSAEASREMNPDAREICAGCPVLRDCEAAAMKEESMAKTSNRMGNIAGKTPSERAKLARQRVREGLKPWEYDADFEYTLARKNAKAS